VNNAIKSIVECCEELLLVPSLPRRGFVYFLIDGEEIVYVGRTTNVEQRVALHLNDVDKRVDVKVFNRVLWREVPLADYGIYENALIRALRPKYNRRAGAWVGRDNEALAFFGLTLLDDEKANAREFAASVHEARPHAAGENHWARRRKARALRESRVRAFVEAA
jgi:hypothetical protein